MPLKQTHILSYKPQKARHRIGNGLLRFCGAPSGMSACGWRRPLSLRRSAPCVLRWKTLTRFLSSAPCRVRIPALEKKKPVTTRVTGFAFQMVPPAGFEPAISTLKGWRPWPLDDGDSGKEYSRLFCRRVYRWQTGKPPQRCLSPLWWWGVRGGASWRRRERCARRCRRGA